MKMYVCTYKRNREETNYFFKRENIVDAANYLQNEYLLVYGDKFMNLEEISEQKYEDGRNEV